MPRSIVLLLAAAALGTSGLSSAGGATWTSSPTSGPSPNTIQVSGDGCYAEINGTSLVVAGGQNGPVFRYGRAVVELLSQDGNEVLEEKEYMAGQQSGVDLGEWGGSFPIPSGLAPGVYPLTAHCELIALVGYGVAVAGPVEVEPITYEDRSYSVLAPRDPAKAVEAEVRLTG